MKNFKWEGVMPALTTQFDKAEKLNLKAFELNLRAQIDAGVHGIILGGTLGEASTLTAMRNFNCSKSLKKLFQTKFQ